MHILTLKLCQNLQNRENIAFSFCLDYLWHWNWLLSMPELNFSNLNLWQFLQNGKKVLPLLSVLVFAALKLAFINVWHLLLLLPGQQYNKRRNPKKSPNCLFVPISLLIANLICLFSPPPFSAVDSLTFYPPQREMKERRAVGKWPTVFLFSREIDPICFALISDVKLCLLAISGFIWTMQIGAVVSGCR